MTSNMIGREFKIVETNDDMFGIELIVLRGLKSLTTLMAENPSPCISLSSLLLSWLCSSVTTPYIAAGGPNNKEIQPIITTVKSSMFHESLR